MNDNNQIDRNAEDSDSDSLLGKLRNINKILHYLNMFIPIVTFLNFVIVLVLWTTILLSSDSSISRVASGSLILMIASLGFINFVAVFLLLVIRERWVNMGKALIEIFAEISDKSYPPKPVDLREPKLRELSFEWKSFSRNEKLPFSYSGASGGVYLIINIIMVFGLMFSLYLIVGGVGGSVIP